MLDINLSKLKICIVGLGYVGLPLAIEFALKYRVVGYDISKLRVSQLSKGIDHTNEAEIEKLNMALHLGRTDDSIGLDFSSDLLDINDSNVYIVTVPTPINQFKSPDLAPLLSASETIGQVLKKGDLVIYESTVYPGCTEEDCVPVLENTSGLLFNEDFFCGYSPERINPGDKINTLTKIKKVTSGSTPEIAQLVDDLYKSIIEAGTHKAPSIKVAEASKAVENAQRDVNISFVNELALIFEKMGIDTNDVLEAAGTKWNFLKYKPGLVGGHCISVDPYYLAHKAESLGYYPQVILSGRRVNDGIAAHIASVILNQLLSKKINLNNCNILILGITFKENCPDIRNTKVADLYNSLNRLGFGVHVYDPVANADEVFCEYAIKLIDKVDINYSVVILAVPHEELILGFDYLYKNAEIIYDLKAVLPREFGALRL
jgi:UDP-N-acetyl-D-galactosamine dehydrogenase